MTISENFLFVYIVFLLNCIENLRNDRNDGDGDENDGGADHDSVKGEQRQLSLTWLPSGRPPFPY